MLHGRMQEKSTPLLIPLTGRRQQVSVFRPRCPEEMPVVRSGNMPANLVAHSMSCFTSAEQTAPVAEAAVTACDEDTPCESKRDDVRRARG
jgi:hypothetical protein